MACGWVRQVLSPRKWMFREMADPRGCPQGSLPHVALVCHEAAMVHLPDSVGEEIGAQKSQEGGLQRSALVSCCNGAKT